MNRDLKNKNVSYFAKTNFREEGKLFGIYQHDRLLHTYILGKTGVGKTNLLTTLILQDIIHGRAVCVFDVHGDLINTLLKYIPLFDEWTSLQSPFLFTSLKHVFYTHVTTKSRTVKLKETAAMPS